MRIAVLEDDVSQRELVSQWLQLAGHQCHAFEQGAALLRRLQGETFDVLVLDWNVADMNGIEVLRKLRHQLRSSVPVLFVSSRCREEDVATALREGADDYMTKPVSRPELLARAEAVVRRGRHALKQQAGLLEIDPFKIHFQTHSIWRNDTRIDCTAKDFGVAALLLSTIGRLLSRGHIRDEVWGQNVEVNSWTLYTHVSRVRTKLALRPAKGWKITAVYRYGYRLDRIAQRMDDGHG
jgi:two-component system response regulator RegX3